MADGVLMGVPPARQGPGPMPPAVIDAVDLSIVRRGAGLLPGERLAPGSGVGTELAQLRPYVVGDDVRQLDPSASARTGVPHVRLQVPERILTTWLVLDVSPSMAFGTADRLKSDVAEGVSLVFGRLASRRGGRLAIVTAGGTERMVPPRGGPHAQVGLRRLLEEGVALDGTPGLGLDRALTRVGKMAKHRGLAVVVSDLRDPDHSWRRPMAALAARHHLICVEIRDPREENLPAAGRLALVDPESGRRLEVDTSRPELRARFAKRAAEERAEVAALLRKTGAHHIVLSTEGDWLKRLGKALG